MLRQVRVVARRGELGPLRRGHERARAVVCFASSVDGETTLLALVAFLVRRMSWHSMLDRRGYEYEVTMN